MATEELRPTSTVSTSATPLPSGTAHGVLSDDSDDTYVRFSQAGERTLVGLSDPDLPDGAAILSVRADLRLRKGAIPAPPQLRAKIKAGGEEYEATLAITWTTHSRVTFVTTQELGLSDLADATLELWKYSGTTLVDVAEAYLVIVHVPRPVVTITSPTGEPTIENTTSPTFTWEAELDPDGGPQTHHQVRVFSTSQVEDGGFDPDDADTWEPVYDSGERQGPNSEHTSSDPLPVSEQLHAYVRVAQTVNGELLWSEWVSEAFTLDPPLPHLPALTVTPEGEAARLRLDLESAGGGDETPDAYEIQCLHEGAWVPLRTIEGNGRVTAEAGEATAWDHEAPNGRARYIRARSVLALTEGEVLSEWVYAMEQWESDTVWLKHPTDPSLDVPLNVYATPQPRQAANQSAHNVLGRPNPVVTTGPRGQVTGEVVVWVDTEEERSALAQLLDEQRPLLLQHPASHHDPDRWIMVGDLGEQRPVDLLAIEDRLLTLPWTQVDRPSGDLASWGLPGILLEGILL